MIFETLPFSYDHSIHFNWPSTNLDCMIVEISIGRKLFLVDYIGYSDWWGLFVDKTRG